MSNQVLYNTNLAKGTGFINETLELLALYEKGDSKKQFLERCLSINPLGKSTEKRTKDLISLVFFDRYWKDDVPGILKETRDSGISLSVVKKLFLIYTARANTVLQDFIIEFFFEKKKDTVSTIDSRNFIDGAISIGLAQVWSEAMRKRVSSYLITCCKDFDLIDKAGNSQFFFPEAFVINYFLHELHFSGLSDNQIPHDKTWKLLQLDEHQTLKEFEKLSYSGCFIFQTSGELMHITWKYKSMQEFIEHECR